MAHGLGRGLGSLIPKKTVTYGRNPYQEEAAAAPLAALQDGDHVLKISPDQIRMNPQQPRTHFNELALADLAESIREHGIIQPLVVTRKGDHYELIAGERRWRSSKLLGLKEVPVIVREGDEQKKLELALIENLQRENLNPLESARAYKRLIDEFNITQEEAAKKLGKARSSVANTLRLLALPLPAQEALAGGRISEAHAKYLLGLEDETKQLNLLKRIIRQNLTVAQTDREIRRIGGTKASKPKADSDLAREKELSRLLATKVEIKRQGRGGKVVIDFYSDGELTELIEKLK